MQKKWDSTYEIGSITASGLASDANAKTIREMAKIAYRAFREPPWQDDLSLPRLHYGLGLDLMRPGAKALVARYTATDKAVGYILGYEAFKKTSMGNDLTLKEISGANQLDYLCNNGKRVFYCDTLCVDSRYRGEKIGEGLSRSLNDCLRRERELDYRLDRTHINAEAAGGLYRKLEFTELQVRDHRFRDRSFWLLDIET